MVFRISNLIYGTSTTVQGALFFPEIFRRTPNLHSSSAPLHLFFAFTAFASPAFSCKRRRIFSLAMCKTRAFPFLFFLSFLTKIDMENGSLSLHS
jgi:hypothetical protein